MLAISLLAASHAAAQPSVTGVSGQWGHQGTVTVSGTGFGSKPSGPPIVWDDSSAASITDKWDGGWPDQSANPTYNVNYRTPIRGIGPPHSRVGRYLAGAHAENSGYNAGYNVMVWKSRTVSFPSYSYVSWYERADPAWTFGNNNFKVYDWSLGNEPYDLPHNWYAEYNPPMSSASSSCDWHLNDDFTSLQNPSSWWGGSCTNPMTHWVKVEVMVKWSHGSDGFVKILDNGAQVMNYAGPTDQMSGNSRAEAVGGYSGQSGFPNNWRYFTDIYLDYTLAHVILGNAPTYNASTVREAQVPISWSSSSITLTVNAGTFAEGQTAYVYVMDPNGNVNQQGKPVTIGSGSGTNPPLPPTNLRIVR